jgi:hypothetical protein
MWLPNVDARNALAAKAEGNISARKMETKLALCISV